MSGNWNTKPRKGEKSINAVRSDQEHRVRVEYRDAGRIGGLVEAWSIAESFNRPETISCEVSVEVAMRIAMELLRHFPKAGRVALANAGASVELVDAAENRVATERRRLAQALKAAKSIGDDIDGA